MGPDAMMLFSECWSLGQLFHFPLSLSSRGWLFSSSSLSATRVVSFAYPRLLIFLLAILIPGCNSSNPAFLMMYSAYKLNKQVTIYGLDVFLSLFGTSLLFHVQFQVWVLPDLHPDFSGGRSRGLIFPSLEEFSTVCGDPHSQRLWHCQ